MTIQRKIDGRVYDFDLTSDELYEAFREQEHLFDRADVESYFDDYTDDDLQYDYGIDREELEERFDDMAYEMRRNIDKYEMDWTYARDAAIAEIL